MPAFQIERSIIVDASLEKVKDSLSDFTQWPHWSPWLITEPDARLDFKNEQGKPGASYEWNGELVGQGKMELLEIDEAQPEIVRLNMKLDFVSPFKSEAKVSFELQSQPGSESNTESSNARTKVSWQMLGKLPIFMFFMVKKMKGYIGHDYERGLRMFKEYIETGSVASSVTINGMSTIHKQRYLGIKRKCSITKLPEMMTQDFSNLFDLVEEKGLSREVIPFSITNQFDIVKDKCKYVVAIPLNQPVIVNPPYFIKTLKAKQVYKVTHKGSYAHLGNGWATIMQAIRIKRIKARKNAPLGIEFYMNDPTQTSPQELLTEIVVPVRG